MQISVSKDRWPRAILLLLPLAFAIFVATHSWRVNTQLADDYAQVTRSYAIAASVVAVMGRVTDGETAERGFVITGNEAYLEPYVLFTSTIEDLYANLVALTANDPVQAAQIVSLRALLDRRKEELARIIRLRRESGFDAAQTAVASGHGKEIHDRIRELVRVVSEREWNAIHRGKTSIATATQNSAQAVVLTSLAVAILGLAIFIANWLGGKRTAVAEAAKWVAEAEKVRLQVELARNF